MQVQLRDGRMLGYAEFGDLQGKPVFYFHGWPGSRMDAALLDEAAKRVGVRAIAIDRPGYGLSDFKPGRTLLDWPEDVVELADALGIGRFAAMGTSGGGPYAAVCAAKLGDRLTRTAIVCGISKFDVPQATKGMMRQNRLLFFICRRLPWLFPPLLAFGIRKLRRDPDRALEWVCKRLSEPDRLVLSRPEVKQPVLASAPEAFRQGTRGPALDGRIYVRPWGFRLQDIPAKVDLWHGELDANVPASMGRYQAGAIPKCHARFFPDEGHVSLGINRIADILRSLATG